MKISARRLVGIGAAALLAVSLAACSSDDTPSDTPSTETGTFAKDADTIVFGVVPDQQAANNLNQPLADYIAAVTGKEVEYLQVTDYATLIESTAAGQVDVAFLSGFTYYQALNAGADITPFAAAVTKAGATPGYDSVAIANPNSGVKTLADFAGKKICFVNENSTSGRLFPLSVLLDAGITEDKYTTVFAGAHDASVTKITEGSECDAGFAEDAKADPAIEAKDVVEISRVTVPGAPIVYQNALPESIKTILVDKLQNASWEDMQAAGVADAGQDWFKAWIYELKPIDDSYYDSIRTLCELVKAPACSA